MHKVGQSSCNGVQVAQEVEELPQSIDGETIRLEDVTKVKLPGPVMLEKVHGLKM